MILREIVLTCSNPHVARAAVASIGGDFARRVACAAERRSLSSGVFAAGLVRRFSARAAESDWEGADQATHGADMPILCGLRYIIERGLEVSREGSAPSLGWRAPAPLQSPRDTWRNCA